MVGSKENDLEKSEGEKRNWLQITVFILLAFFAVSPIFLRKQSEFDSVFLVYSKMLINGLDIYHEGTPYLYPPWTAFLCIPFTWVPHWLARAAFGILNLAFLILAIVSAWRLASTYSQKKLHAIWVLVVGLLCTATFFLNCTSHQQMDVLIAGFMLVGCLLILHGKDVRGGILLGIAASFKMTPLLFLPYFAYRGRPMAIVSLSGVFLFCNFLPDWVIQAPDGKSRMVAYLERHLLPMTKPDFVPGTWGSEIVYNQSLSGFAKRVVQTRLEKEGGKWQVKNLHPADSTGTVKFLFLALVGPCLGYGFFTLGKPGRNESDFPLEASLVICGMLLLSPMSGMAHFGILVLPAFCLAMGGIQGKWKFAKWFVALPLICGLMLNKDLVGESIYSWMLWIGLLTVSSLSLFTGCGLALILNRKSLNSQKMEPSITRAA